MNGVISLGSTCGNTVGDPTTWHLTTQETLDLIEARPEMGGKPAHPPGVFQSANDYGEETTELEIACRLLGNDCTYELQTMITNRRLLLNSLSVNP